MGQQRRKFETGFKQQIVQEVESGQLSVSAATRKYQISGSVIDRRRQQARQSGSATPAQIQDPANPHPAYGSVCSNHAGAP